MRIGNTRYQISVGDPEVETIEIAGRKGTLTIQKILKALGYIDKPCTAILVQVGESYKMGAFMEGHNIPQIGIQTVRDFMLDEAKRLFEKKDSGNDKDK